MSANWLSLSFILRSFFFLPSKSNCWKRLLFGLKLVCFMYGLTWLDKEVVGLFICWIEAEFSEWRLLLFLSLIINCLCLRVFISWRLRFPLKADMLFVFKSSRVCRWGRISQFVTIQRILFMEIPFSLSGRFSLLKSIVSFRWILCLGSQIAYSVSFFSLIVFLLLKTKLECNDKFIF